MLRLLAAAIAAGTCVVGAAYATTLPGLFGKPADGGASAVGEPGGGARHGGAGHRRLPRPRITKHPGKMSTSTNARFAFAAPSGPRFHCRLDRRRWIPCRSPLRLRALRPGRHRFRVRSVRRRQHGPAASFAWSVVEPRQFSIEPQLSEIPSLYPGAGPVELPVVLSNPHPVPIAVTSLTVSVASDIPGCDSAANFESIPASLSAGEPLRLPAKGSTRLPAPGISPPAIALRNLSVNQDGCQGVQVPLSFSGEARG